MASTPVEQHKPDLTHPEIEDKYLATLAASGERGQAEVRQEWARLKPAERIALANAAGTGNDHLPGAAVVQEGDSFHLVFGSSKSGVSLDLTNEVKELRGQAPQPRSLYATDGSGRTVPVQPGEAAPTDQAVAAAGAPPEGSKPDRPRTLYDGTKRETYRDDKGVSAIVDQDAQGHLVGSLRRNDDGTFTRYNAQGQPVETGITNVQVDKHAAVHYVNGEGHAVYQHVQRPDGQTYRDIHQSGDEKSPVVAQDHEERGADGTVKHTITDKATGAVTIQVDSPAGAVAIQYPPDGDKQTTYYHEPGKPDRWETKLPGDVTDTTYDDGTRVVDYPTTANGEHVRFIHNKDGDRRETQTQTKGADGNVTGSYTVTNDNDGHVLKQETVWNKSDGTPDHSETVENPGTPQEKTTWNNADGTVTTKTNLPDGNGSYFETTDGKNPPEVLKQETFWNKPDGSPDHSKTVENPGTPQEKTTWNSADGTVTTEGPDGKVVKYPEKNGEQTTYTKDKAGERWVTKKGDQTITDYPPAPGDESGAHVRLVQQPGQPDRYETQKPIADQDGKPTGTYTVTTDSTGKVLKQETIWNKNGSFDHSETVLNPGDHQSVTWRNKNGDGTYTNTTSHDGTVTGTIEDGDNRVISTFSETIGSDGTVTRIITPQWDGAEATKVEITNGSRYKFTFPGGKVLTLDVAYGFDSQPYGYELTAGNSTSTVNHDPDLPTELRNWTNDPNLAWHYFSKFLVDS